MSGIVLLNNVWVPEYSSGYLPSPVCHDSEHRFCLALDNSLTPGEYNEGRRYTCINNGFIEFIDHNGVLHYEWGVQKDLMKTWFFPRCGLIAASLQQVYRSSFDLSPVLRRHDKKRIIAMRPVKSRDWLVKRINQEKNTSYADILQILRALLQGIYPDYSSINEVSYSSISEYWKT